MLKVQNVSLKLENSTILKDISCELAQGKLYGLIGHNGSGKSSLIKLLAGEIEQTAGQVSIHDSATSSTKEINKIPAKERAKTIAYLPQTLPQTGSFTVEEIVMLGRYPWQKWLQKPSQQDKEIVKQSMEYTQIADKATQNIATLSGGEKARAWLAMCLAQQTDFLLLDEPLAALDIVYQVEILKIVKNLIAEKNLGVVLILHDINLASEYCDDIIALKQGQICHSGAVAEVMQQQALHDIYGIDLHLIDHPVQAHKVALL